MKVCILGAGVIGLTTAWELAERGHEVVIVDRHRDVGMGTSLANAGQLSFAYVAPLATPETLRRLPALVFDRDAPVRIRPSLDPAFLRWCAAFVGACTTRRMRATIEAQLALAALSRGVLEGLATSQALSFGRRAAGKLVLYRKGVSFAPARTGVRPGQEVLSPRECLALEPSLLLEPRDLAGGIYTADEQVGDCHTFCRELAARLRLRGGVEWRLGTKVLHPLVKGRVLREIATDTGVIAADRFVLAFGPEAPRFARSLGLRLPISPMKGHSITIAPRAGAPPLEHSVTDYDRKMACAPLADARRSVVRVTGGVDLVGHDRHVEPKCIEALALQAGRMLALDLDGDLRPWAGLRPATPDGRPIIGWSPIRGLFLNVGHGALGWTLACGSARLAAELMEGEPASVEPGWFALARTR